MDTNNVLSNSRRRRGRHRKSTAHQPYSWLGPAAFTLGIGAALIGGSTGIAHADDAAPSDAPSADTAASPASVSGSNSTHSGKVAASRALRQPDGGLRQSAASVESAVRDRLPTPAASPARSSVVVPSSNVGARPGSLDAAETTAAAPLTLQPLAAPATAASALVSVAPAPAVPAASPGTSPIEGGPAAGVQPAPLGAVTPQTVAAPASAATTAPSGSLLTPGSVTGLSPSTDPVVPVSLPVVWTLAAAARQEINASAAATAAPAAAVSTGAPPAPAPAAAVPLPAASGTARGTARVVQLVNVRNAPSTAGPVVAQYTPGMTFNYDSYTDANGFRWLSYVSGSGVRRYVAQQTLDGKTVYVTGGVPLSSPPPPAPTPPPTPAPTPTSKAVAAVNKALSRVNFDDFGPQGCGKFVAYAYGVPGIGYNTALEFRNALASKGLIHMDYSIPLGALVFSQSKYDLGAGHVDIARGNGQFISGGVATSYGTHHNVQLLSSWNPSPGAQYLGWAYAPW